MHISRFSRESIISQQRRRENTPDYLALTQQYTGGTFRSIVHPEEYEAVEQSIWEQVQQPNSDGNDAVRYRIITKSGQVKCILDKGRLVETDVYGKVFYVLMIDESNW